MEYITTGGVKLFISNITTCDILLIVNMTDYYLCTVGKDYHMYVLCIV